MVGTKLHEGLIDLDFMKEFLGNYEKNKQLLLLCGPNPMNKQMKEYALSCNYSSTDDIFVF